MDLHGDSPFIPPTAPRLGPAGVWQGLLRSNVQQARRPIRKLLAGRLIVTPSEDYTLFTVSGTGLIEPLLDQTVRIPKAVTPAGFAPAFTVRHALS